MRPARCCAVLVLAYVVFLAITASSAQAIGTVDSKCTGGNSGGFAIVSYGGEWTQTFVAGRSGKLLTVEVKGIARQPEGTEDIHVHLYGMSESGSPVTPALSETTIAAAGIPTDAVARDYTANFNPETATYLEAGKSYAIGISSSDSKQDSWNFQAGDSCPAGELLTGPSPFHPFNGNTEWDAGLTTYLGPENDDFDDALVLSGQNVVAEGTTAGATRQDPGEPDHYTIGPPADLGWVGDHSVWFRWTAPNSGPTTIDTCFGEIDSILAVYTGSELGSLSRVTDNNNNGCTPDVYGSKVSFEAIAGTTYDIAVGDAGGAREMPFGLIISGASDLAPPETTIDSGPSGPTTGASATFTFSSSEAGSTFECRLDSSQAAAFKACTSPQSYSSLSLGAHTFEVRATDKAENVDPTPAARSFAIEAPPTHPGGGAVASAPPDSFIRKAKISQAKNKATFRFASDESDATFLCKLDRKPFKGCQSPKTYSNLKPGKHRFQVVALDAAGDRDPTPAVRAFKLQP